MRTIIIATLLFATTYCNAQTGDCFPPVSSAVLNINNVRARVNNGLHHFTGDGSAGYEVPIAAPGEPSIHSIYADGLWVGGKTASNQLRTSIAMYGGAQGSDYFAGPLRIDGTASTEIGVCNQYDQVYTVNRSDALLHREYQIRIELVSDGADPAILTEPPFENGYVIPESFNLWPGNNSTPGFSFYLAPYYDWNGDGIYNPQDGDYPHFDLNGDVNCQDYSLTESLPLYGHQALWYVSNDASEHTEYPGLGMGLEVQVSTFAYSTCDEIDETVFVRNLIINRSSETYLDCGIAKWLDTDIGCSTDDYVGCDVSRGMAYGYNGDISDVACGVSGLGYGANPPAIGIDILKGPLQDADGLDNSFSSDLSQALANDGIVYAGQGTGYGDSQVDNERMGMRHFISYNIGGNPTNGDVGTQNDGYNFLSGNWKDGSDVTYGGDGIGGSIACDYMFPGESDPLGFSTDGEVEGGNWSEVTEANQVGDRRFVLSTGKFTMEPGEINELIVAYVWARTTQFGGTSVPELQAADDVVQAAFDNCFQAIDDFPLLSSFQVSADDETVLFNLPVYSSDQVTWSFGDGGTAVGYAVSHTYSAPGSYEVCATYEQCNSEIELCQLVNISPSLFFPVLQITRTEGRGCGAHYIELEAQEIENMLQGPEYYEAELTYKIEHGPIKVTVYDEENFVPGQYAIGLYGEDEDLPDEWKLWKVGELDTIYSDQDILTLVDQNIPEYGLVVSIEQPVHQVLSSNTIPNLLGASMTYADPSVSWLGGVADAEGETEQNWIRSGLNTQGAGPCDPLDPNNSCYYFDVENGDPDERFENVLGGTWSPWFLASISQYGPSDIHLNTLQLERMTALNNVVLQLTPDKSKWSRVPVVEEHFFPIMTQGKAKKLDKRRGLSVDKNGLNQLNGGNIEECTLNGIQVFSQEDLNLMSTAIKTEYKQVAWPTVDPNTIPDANLIGLSFGMGWFPGFAVDVETGFRANLAFGENSSMVGENGRDMIWNPTGTMYTSEPVPQPVYGGGHYLYVFRSKAVDDLSDSDTRMRGYDNGQFMYENLDEWIDITKHKRVYRCCTWVTLPILQDGYTFLPISEGLIPTETTIRLNVSKDYRTAMLAPFDTETERFPQYTFTVPENVFSALNEEESITELNIFPNPAEDGISVSIQKLGTKIKEIQVMDMSGKIVLAQRNLSSSEFHLDIKTLTPGMYFMQVLDETGSSSTKKFVKR